jgi:hypothetical protein
VAWIDRDHGSIQKGPPFCGATANHFQVFLREGQRMEITDEFRGAYRFSVKEELLFFGRENGNPQLTNHGLMFYSAFDSAFLAAVSNAVSEG